MKEPCSKCSHFTMHGPERPCTHYVESLTAECGCTGALTPMQIELARHALGLPNKMKMSFRNRYVASVGHDKYEDWIEMVDAGHAESFRDPGGQSVLFWLTKDAAKQALKKGERLDPEDFAGAGPSRIKNRLSDGPPLPRMYQ